MTGPSLLEVSRKTQEGYKVTYCMNLPWQLRRVDYDVKPAVLHQGRFFVVKDLLWKGKPCEVACMPYGCMVPRADWPVDAHGSLTTLSHAQRYLGHRTKTLDGNPVVLDVSCWKEGSSVHAPLDAALWLPSTLRLSVSFDCD